MNVFRYIASRGSGSKAYFKEDGVRRGYELGNSDAVDLLIEEKYSHYIKNEETEETEIEEHFSEKEKEVMREVIGEIRKCSVTSLSEEKN